MPVQAIIMLKNIIKYGISSYKSSSALSFLFTHATHYVGKCSAIEIEVREIHSFQDQ